MENPVLTNQICMFRDPCKKFSTGECQCLKDDPLCERFFKLYHLYKNSLLPEPLWSRAALVLEENSPDKLLYKELSDLSKDIKTFVAEGRSLFLYSRICGNGKTMWAVKLLQAYCRQIWPESYVDASNVLFISVPRFLTELKSAISKGDSEYLKTIRENVESADLVIWDEIAAKRLTEYEHEQLFPLIDARTFNHKSNIYTSNRNPNELSLFIGERLQSRICTGSSCKELRGADKRGIKK